MGLWPSDHCEKGVAGPLIFRSLLVLPMCDSDRQAVRQAVLVETVSMNMVMAGMIPIILLFRTQYPINSWMVAKEIKHGMMSRPQGKAKKVRHHHPTALPWGKQMSLVLRTYAFLIMVVYLCSYTVPIKFL